MAEIEALAGKRVLVTGATGLFGLPLATELAKGNEVFASARFTDEAARKTLESAGATTVRWDLLDPDLSALPEQVDYVFHAGALLHSPQLDQRTAFQANTQAVGRLMYHYRDCAGFLHCSSAATYAVQESPVRKEDSPQGILMPAMASYALSKIASEQLVEFLSRQLDIPAVVLRIFGLYGPRGGAPTMWLRMVKAGQTIPLYPGGSNPVEVIYETDFVEKAIGAAKVASVPPLILNFSSTEENSVEQLCEIAAGILGTKAKFVVTENTYPPMQADMSALEKLLGPTRVSLEEGVARVLEALD